MIGTKEENIKVDKNEIIGRYLLHIYYKVSRNHLTLWNEFYFLCIAAPQTNTDSKVGTYEETEIMQI